MTLPEEKPDLYSQLRAENTRLSSKLEKAIQCLEKVKAGPPYPQFKGWNVTWVSKTASECLRELGK